MSCSRLSYLAFVFIVMAAGTGYGQSKPPSSFHPGQSMYIVAFRTFQYPYILDDTQIERQRDYINYDLDAERKVRKRIDEWRFFKVAEKPSDADFVFLVRLDGSSMEGLAIPFEAYSRYFKDKFDLDALRDAAVGRYLIGPLKLPTLSRLSDRLVQEFRAKVGSNKQKTTRCEFLTPRRFHTITQSLLKSSAPSMCYLHPF